MLSNPHEATGPPMSPQWEVVCGEPVAEGESDDEPLTLTTERVDDIPLLLAQLEAHGAPAPAGRAFSHHGNWVGLSWVGERALADSYSLGG